MAIHAITSLLESLDILQNSQIYRHTDRFPPEARCFIETSIIYLKHAAAEFNRDEGSKIVEEEQVRVTASTTEYYLEDSTPHILTNYCCQEICHEILSAARKIFSTCLSLSPTMERKRYAILGLLGDIDLIKRKKEVRAILRELGGIDLIDTKEEANFYSKKFRDETKLNQLECFNHLRIDEDKEKYISSVGLDEQLDILVSELIQSSPQVEILAIVGMGGIGKTTLAKGIFNDQRVSYHFDLRAWVRISQVYHKRDMLLQLLRCVTHPTKIDGPFDGKDDAALEEMLYKSLKRRRYLLVMDDMWSKKAWTELGRIFPDDKMGSRVLWTSRESIASEGLDCKLVHRMCLLSENRSWELLQKRVFGEDLCPNGLVNTGRQIAKNCQGLPLAIAVVAGVLLKVNKTTESWKGVAESVSSVIVSSENHCQAIFRLSYENLPRHLKSCFLYMGAFPGGSEIKAWTLIRLWIAEGFILCEANKSLEDVAEGYLNSLIDRSLVLVGKRRSDDDVKTCYLHDLLLEFCIQEAQKERFMHVVKDCRDVHCEGRIDKRARFSFRCQTYGDIYLTASKSLAVSALFFKGCSSVPDILIYYFDFKLLKVLDIISLQFDSFPVEQVTKLLLLRYLAFTASFKLPSIIFQLQRLETLIVNGPWFPSGKISALPSDFWRSLSLRHLQLQVANHLFPHKNFGQANLIHLQTLSKLTLASCTRENFACFPNIIELGICESHEDMPIVGMWDILFLNLFLLKHLQTLKLSCYAREHTRVLPMLNHNAFPQSLKKLTLWRSHLPWEAMASLGGLPNLEVLKLRNYAFRGPEWTSVEGGFERLKYLLIEETDLEVWNLQECHFPQLQRLILKFCYKLKALPYEMGDICTLKQIELHFCSASAEQSAKEMQEEQLKECCNDIGVLIRTHRPPSTASLQEMNE